ncbi:MAG: hypothetical protein HOU01_18305 [Streptomycetaceae bacterium]|nr:hypothetical protein [Streptomycetaceae bacterium]
MSRTVDLHRAERRAIDVGINLAAAAFVWWRFRRPTAKGVVAAVVTHLPARRWAR